MNDEQRLHFLATFDPDAAAAAWHALTAAVSADNPGLTHGRRGAMAALGILTAMDREAAAWARHVDAVSRHEPWIITDAMDALYRGLAGRIRDAAAALEALSGARFSAVPHPEYTAAELMEAAGLELAPARPCRACRGEAACCSCV